MNFSRHKAHLAGDLAVRRGLMTQDDLEQCLEIAEAGKSLQSLLEARLDPGAFAGLLRDLRTDDLRTLIDTAVPQEIRDADPSRRFGKYILGSEIGRGGMGVVHRAWQEDLGRWVALKILRVEAGTARFLQEAQLAARVTHPNLVPIYEVSQEKTIPYIAMALLEGGSLERRTLSPKEAVEAMSSVALAVDEIHRRGIVHRDIKPANLLLDGRGRIFLGDFGLARPLEDVAKLSASGTFVGTLGFAPPEQVSGDREAIGPRSDVYSLGATLYALVSGRPPFEGSDVFSTAQKVLHDEPPSLRKIHRDLDTICRRAMAKRPGDRYASAVEFGQDLKRFLAGENIAARPSSILSRAARGIRRHRAVVAAVVAIAGGIGVAVLVKPGGDPTREAAFRSLEEARELLKGAHPRITEARSLLSGIRGEPALMGQVCYLLGDLPGAEKQFTEALKTSRDPSILAARSRVRVEQALWSLGSGDDPRDFLDRGDSGPLVAVLRDLAGRRFDAAIAGCDAEIRNGSPEIAYEIARGMARLFQGKPEDAIGDFTNAIRHSPANALAFYARAAAHERMGRRAEAIGDYSRTHELRPSFVRVLVNKAVLQQVLGDNAGALATYDQAIRAAPDDLGLQAERISVLHRAGRDALPDAQAFVASHPRFPRGYLSRGEILRAKGRPHEALQDFDTAVDLEPGSAFAYAARGELYIELLDFKRGEADLSQAISIGGHRAFLVGWHLQRGRARAGLVRNEESHEDFDVAVRADPTNADYVFNRGYLRFLLKRFDEARADLNEAARLRPSLETKVRGILDLMK